MNPQALCYSNHRCSITFSCQPYGASGDTSVYVPESKGRVSLQAAQPGTPPQLAQVAVYSRLAGQLHLVPTLDSIETQYPAMLAIVLRCTLQSVHLHSAASRKQLLTL
jgi:hypothetical protein